MTVFRAVRRVRLAGSESRGESGLGGKWIFDKASDEPRPQGGEEVSGFAGWVSFNLSGLKCAKVPIREDG